MPFAVGQCCDPFNSTLMALHGCAGMGCVSNGMSCCFVLCPEHTHCLQLQKVPPDVQL